MNTYLPENQSSLLIEIEQVVQMIIDCCSKEQYQKIYNQLYHRINAYLPLYHSNYDYSEYINALWFGCNQISIFLVGSLVSPQPLDRLIHFIRSYTKLPLFKRHISDRRYQTKANNKSLTEYASHLHQQYHRLLVVRLDLGYRTDNLHLVTIDEHYFFLDELIRQYYKNSLFEHLVGHAWCMEQGETKGYHIHVAYYFKGSKHQNDYYMGRQIGDLWLKVTKGLGTYHSCNTPKEKQKYEKMGTLGVGMIKRQNSISCDNAVNSVRYLTAVDKTNQYLRMKPKGRRTFGTGLSKSLRRAS